MGRKLLGGVVGVLAVARDLVRHTAWYVRYQVNGTPRDEGARPPERPPRT